MHTGTHGSGVLVAWPGDDNELGEPKQVLPAMPARDFRERIGPDDEEGLFAQSAHALHGVHRIALAASRLQIRDHEPRVFLASQFRHPETVLVCRAGMIGLMRRVRGWNKPYLV